MFLIKLLFFLSGSAGLMYEIIWTRLFSDIVGSTALSMTSVFSVFLFSLALGARLATRFSVYGKQAFMLYGKIEIAIALSALGTSATLLFGKSWLAIHLPTSSYFLLDLSYKLILTFIVIGIPSLLMGATLPIILNATQSWTLPQNVVTQLYGWNTLGAACGSFLTGFFFIWKLGLSLTLFVAIFINLLVGIAVFILGRNMPETTVELPPAPPALATEEKNSRFHSVIWFFVAFLSGFNILGYEILWGRIAKFLMGDRTIAITILLFGFISCLGISSLVAPRIGKRWGGQSSQGTMQLISWLFLWATFVHLFAVFLARFTIAGHGLAVWLPIENNFVRPVLTMWILIIPPIFILGLVFPLMIWSAKEVNQFPGKVIGNLYFINTIGATLGAITSSFVLSRWIGTLGGFIAFHLILISFAMFILFLNTRSSRQKIMAVIMCLCLLVLTYLSPTSMVQLLEDETLLETHEDEYGVQVLVKTDAGRMRTRNNRLSLVYELGHPDTSHAQQMAAHLSMVSAKECKDVLNIGTGYGITAGTFVLYPEVKSIETVEILPFLVQHQNYFADYNFDYLKDPRSVIKQADGRHQLAISPKTYDIISVNVLDPYLPGSSSLYTVDFWEIARDHLNPGGVYTQLFWGKDAMLLLKGLHSVFPTVLCFLAYQKSSYNIIAFKEPVDPTTLALYLERLNPEAIKALESIGCPDPVKNIPLLIAESWERKKRVDSLMQQVNEPFHTDDFPILEFRWSHGVDGVSIFHSPMIKD